MNETTLTASAAGVVQRSKRYKQQSLSLLKHYFRFRISFASIRAVLEANGHSFTESFRALYSIDLLAKDLPEDQRVPRILQEAPFLSRISPILIKQPRDTKRPRRPTEPTLLDEINDIPELNTKKKARNDTEEEAQDDGKQDEEQDKDGEDDVNEEPMYECGCCYVDYSFDDMCQCNDGHLFCLNCLRSHAEENVFGKGQFQIKCLSMDEQCEAGFSDRSLDKAIPDPAMRQRIDEYMMRASLIEAGMNDTSQCPNCAVVGTLPSNQSFVQCPQCDHTYCHQCSEAPHKNKTCQQVKAEKEEKSKTDKRNRVADEMTAAVVRDCPGCQKRFFKVEGCNRMKCPSCKTLSCYICRQQIEDYEHFCLTPHCNHQNCHKCVLNTNSEEDDRRARHEIALKAQENANENQAVAVAAEIGGLLATPGKTHRRPLMAVRRGPPGDAMGGLGRRQQQQQQQHEPLPRRRLRRRMAIHPMNQQQQREVQREEIAAQPQRQAAPIPAAPQLPPRVVAELYCAFACIIVFLAAVGYFYG